MKFSTILAVFAVGLAVAASGCKYDKAGKGGVGAGDDARGSDIDTQEINADSDNRADTGSISGVSEGKFEDLYPRCTDVDFTPVYFGFDSTVVPAGELGKIDAVAQHLTAKADRVVENLNHLRVTAKTANSPTDQTLSTIHTVRSAGEIPDHTIRTSSNASMNPILSKPTANNVFIHFTQFSTLRPGTLLA